MSFSRLHDKLIAAARATPPDDRVPLAFERRIMAHLADKKPLDAWGLWGQALTRAAVFCLAVMVFLAVGSLFLSSEKPEAQSLPQAVESTLIAAVENSSDQAGEVW